MDGLLVERAMRITGGIAKTIASNRLSNHVASNTRAGDAPASQEAHARRAWQEQRAGDVSLRSRAAKTHTTQRVVV